MSESILSVGIAAEIRRSWRRTALRLGNWPRRVLAIGCLALAALSAIDAAQGTQARTRVVVAARDLPAGSAITAAAVRTALWPSRLVSRHAARAVSSVLGRVPASPIGAGEPITTTRLVGADLAVGLPAGTVVATVTIADPAAARVLRPGDHVDLLRGAASGSGAGTGDDAQYTSPARSEVVAYDVRVLAVLSGISDTGADSGVSVAVAVDETTALRLGAASGSPLLATVRPR